MPPAAPPFAQTARAKYDAWAALSGLEAEAARSQYAALVAKVAPPLPYTFLLLPPPPPLLSP